MPSIKTKGKGQNRLTEPAPDRVRSAPEKLVPMHDYLIRAWLDRDPVVDTRKSRPYPSLIKELEHRS